MKLPNDLWDEELVHQKEKRVEEDTKDKRHDQEVAFHHFLREDKLNFTSVFQSVDSQTTMQNP